VPTSVTGDATHFYWWHVADLQFGSNGQLANILPGGSQPTGVLATCAPTPVAMTTFIVDAEDLSGGSNANERSNFCV